MKQHKKPCDECPFGKIAKVKTLGGASVETYIGQIHGPFWLPCHKDKNYAEKASDPNKVSQCAGASIFRANLEVSDFLPNVLNVCEPSEELSFSSVTEFVEHHTGEHREFTVGEIVGLLREEMAKLKVRVCLVPSPNKQGEDHE